MVIPRSRSCGSKSVTVVPSWTSPRLWVVPVAYRIRSVTVVLPASTWARMPRLRTTARLFRLVRTALAFRMFRKRKGVSAIPGRRCVGAHEQDLPPVRKGPGQGGRGARALSEIRHGLPVPAAQRAPEGRRHQDHLGPEGPGTGSGDSDVCTHGLAPLTGHDVVVSVGRGGAAGPRIFRRPLGRALRNAEEPCPAGDRTGARESSHVAIATVWPWVIYGESRSVSLPEVQRCAPRQRSSLWLSAGRSSSRHRHATRAGRRRRKPATATARSRGITGSSICRPRRRAHSRSRRHCPHPAGGTATRPSPSRAVTSTAWPPTSRTGPASPGSR